MNPRISRLVRMVMVIGAGLLVGKGSAELILVGTAVAAKLRGNAPDCPWGQVLTMHHKASRLVDLQEAASSTVSVTRYDEALDIELVSSPQRPFWIKRRGQTRGGKDLLAYLLSEHEWTGETNPDGLVRKGDVVLDCGAHVGVFTHKALRLGARKVVAIEPDPVHIECLRRNFADEIAAGRVIVVPKGVWSSESTMKLFLGTANSGMNSLVFRHRGGTVEVPVTMIDTLVRDLQLARVDYIKMDIEGAEREALKGALETLRRFRPRLMLDSYHLPDDMAVLPAVVRRAHPDYLLTCGPCEEQSARVVPHVIFLE